ncbi:MAG: 50S ribosomal protein L17 [Lentisphaeria bacterium]|nr:50S ribosomal protein L17 [Lentisphaeria bacterium]
MRHKVDTLKLGRSSAHRRAMLANMVSSLFYSGRVETTLVKAKAVRRMAERMITLGKQGTLHSRRLAVARMHDENAVKKLFDEIAPAYTGRQGGYTRILKLGQRRGDAAETCLLMLVEGGEVAGKEKAAAEAQA